MNYPEPHEGIAGIPRPGDPLLTEDGSVVAVRMMEHLHRATLVGNPAPIVREMQERMHAPRAGDAVVVQDVIYFRSDTEKQYRAVGYLITVRAEWWTTTAEWEREIADDPALADEERLVEHRAWYVQYGPEPVDVCRWVNCTVLAIPDGVGP